jgi:hypothetical protein
MKKNNAKYFLIYWLITFLLMRYVPIFGNYENPTKIGILLNVTGPIALIIGIVLLFKKRIDGKNKK